MKEFRCRKCGCTKFRRTRWKTSPKGGAKVIKKRFPEPSRRLAESVVCRKCNKRQKL